MRNADGLLFNQAMKLCSPGRAYTFVGVVLIHIALTRRYSFRYSVRCIPVNLQSVLIAEERRNLLSCPGHLRVKTLLEEQYSAFKLAKYLVSLACVSSETHNLQPVFFRTVLRQKQERSYSGRRCRLLGD